MRCPFFFLVGGARLVECDDLATTGVMAVDDRTARIPIVSGPTGVANLAEEPLLLAVRKTRGPQADLVSVGRTDINDVVLRDPLISKLHASIAIHGHYVELADAGSSNGTFVNEQRLGHRSVHVVPGDTVRFADLAFTLCTAEMCWDRVHGR